MSAWVAHICLRCHPTWIVTVINLSFWVVPVALLIAAPASRGRASRWAPRSSSLSSASTGSSGSTPRTPGRRQTSSCCWTAPTGSCCASTPSSPSSPQRASLASRSVGCCFRSARRSAGRHAWRPWRRRSGSIAFDVTFRHAHEFDPFGFNIYGHFANLLFSTSSLRYRPPTVTGDSRLFLERAAQLPAGAPRTPLPAPRHRRMAAGIGDRPANLRRHRREPAGALDARARRSNARERMAAGADLGRQYLVERVRPADRADPQGLRWRPGRASSTR